MVQITYTNIMIDEFSTARYHPSNRYVHFLSHIHTDHLKGLSNTWDYGVIYCSSITKKLILLKYPRLYNNLKQLELQKQHTIQLSNQLEVTVTLFDSNHCAGGVMILVQGYMGNILYTGDIRYDKELFRNFTYLYPISKRNKQFKACSIPINFLYLDITFLHPRFSFPPKQVAMQNLQTFIKKTIQQAKTQNKFIEFYIGMDSFGKEQVLVNLAQTFTTLITVTEERYKNISSIGLDTDLFTTNPQAGFIHVVMKRQIHRYLHTKPNSIGIILTGWATKSDWRGKNIYAIPYSLHSSYPQLNQFVSSIRPCYIESIIDVNGSYQKSQDSSSSKNTSNNKSQQTGIDDSASNSMIFQNSRDLYEKINYCEWLSKLRKDYTSQASEELKTMMTNIQLQKKIKQKLHLQRAQPDIYKEDFGMNLLRVQNMNRAGVKLNPNRNQQQIQKVKSSIREKSNYSKNIQQLILKRQQKQLADAINQIIQQSQGKKISKQKQKNYIILNDQSSDQMKVVSKQKKWKKQLQQGEIDLFGQMPIKKIIKNPRKSNELLNSKINHSQNFMHKIVQTIDSSMDDQIQILEKEPYQSSRDSSQKNKSSNSNSNSSKSKSKSASILKPRYNKNKSQQEQNQQQTKKRMEIQQYKPPANQRTLTQFFKKKQIAQSNSTTIVKNQQINPSKNVSNLQRQYQVQQISQNQQLQLNQKQISSQSDSQDESDSQSAPQYELIGEVKEDFPKGISLEHVKYNIHKKVKLGTVKELLNMLYANPIIPQVPQDQQ